MRNVNCPYCNVPAHITTGAVLYPHRLDLAHKKIWQCVQCAARVGCHGKTDKPLGTLANAADREARTRAHAAFDRLWKPYKSKRHGAYMWLAKQMGLPPERCHISMMTAEQCAQVVEVCRARGPK